MRHSRVVTTTDVYMHSLHEGVRSTINSIHAELVSTGKGRSKRRAPSKVGTSTEHDAAGESREANPPRIRGKVLEFATRMRQSRGREVALND